MRKSSSLFKQIKKAQKAIEKWPKDWRQGVTFIPVRMLDL